MRKLILPVLLVLAVAGCAGAPGEPARQVNKNTNVHSHVTSFIDHWGRGCTMIDNKHGVALDCD